MAIRPTGHRSHPVHPIPPARKIPLAHRREPRPPRRPQIHNPNRAPKPTDLHTLPQTPRARPQTLGNSQPNKPRRLRRRRTTDPLLRPTPHLQQRPQRINDRIPQFHGPPNNTHHQRPATQRSDVVQRLPTSLAFAPVYMLRHILFVRVHRRGVTEHTHIRKPHPIIPPIFTDNRRNLKPLTRTHRNPKICHTNSLDLSATAPTQTTATQSTYDP